MADAKSDSTPVATTDAGKASSSANNGADAQLLPPLSPAEFRKYNVHAERMNMFHNQFRHSWQTLYNACVDGELPEYLSKRQFIRIGIDLCRHLDIHHKLEERHVFPYLAKRMPAFAHDVELIKQHRVIHQGLDKLEAYLEACVKGQKELKLYELKEIMDGFGRVLWQHMDEEVKALGAENMRKYWTLEEIARMPW
ncbi:hypothetical protein VTO42DRAFT_2295 [Malbranchea cinnamomea]